MIKNSQVTALILAGGLGTRLRKYFPNNPKVMAPINNRPFIYQLLDILEKARIKKVIIGTGYLADKIENVIGGSYKDLNIIYSREEKPLGTGGAVKLAGKKISTQYTLVINGDSYVEFDYNLLLSSHEKSNSVITIVVKNVNNPSHYGNIYKDDQNKIIEFIEKSNSEKNCLINTGVYFMNTYILNNIPNQIPCSLEQDFFQKKIEKNIYVFETKGEFFDIGTPDSYGDAKSFFKEVRSMY